MSAVCSYTDAYYNVISYNCKDQLPLDQRKKYDYLTTRTPFGYSIWLLGDVLSLWNNHFGIHQDFDTDDPACCGGGEGCPAEESCYTTGLLKVQAEKLRLFEHLWETPGLDNTTDTVKTEVLDRHDDFFTCGFDYRRSKSDLNRAANPKYCCEMDLSPPSKNQTTKVWQSVSCGWKALQRPDEIPRLLGFTVTLAGLRFVRELLDIWILLGSSVTPARWAGTMYRLICRFIVFALLIASWTGCDHNTCVGVIPLIEDMRKVLHQLLQHVIADAWTERLFVVLAGLVIAVEIVASLPGVVVNTVSAVLTQRQIDSLERFQDKYLRHCAPQYTKIRGK